MFIREERLSPTVTDLPGGGDVIHESADGSIVVYQCSDSTYWLCQGAGTVRIRDGESITVDPNDGQSPATARWLVLGPGFRSLLAQRGHLVFHGSAVEVDGQAAVFLGASGLGKSTTAAALAAAGNTLLTDDIAPVLESSNGYVLSAGPATARLRPADARRLGCELGRIPSPSVGDRREYVTSRSEDCLDEYPVTRLYLLEWGDGPIIDDPTPVDVVPELLRNSYPGSGDVKPTALSEHFRRCLRLADTVPVRRLRRPKSVDALEDTVSAVEADVNS